MTDPDDRSSARAYPLSAPPCGKYKEWPPGMLEEWLDWKRITVLQRFNPRDRWRVKGIVCCSNSVLCKRSMDRWGALLRVLIYAREQAM